MMVLFLLFLVFVSFHVVIYSGDVTFCNLDKKCLYYSFSTVLDSTQVLC